MEENRQTVQTTKLRVPPATRYQGSKLKLLGWIWDHVGELPFETALDAFGGTAGVSYLFKSHGKAVTYNDCLKFNHLIGTALLENRRVRLSDSDLRNVLRRHPGVNYDDFISKTFADVYFTDEENSQLDIVCQNIARLQGRYNQALAYYALFQAAIIKRPYNLFHRKNLYMRTADVRRGFGNKAAWDRPFDKHFQKFAAEANQAVFDSGVRCRAICGDALAAPGSYDLVYIDPPYVNANGVGVDYRDFYHFLEGLVSYGRWPEMIDRRRRHLPLVRQHSPWSDPHCIHDAFRKVFRRFAESILVVSYRSDGMPGLEELVEMLRAVKRRVHCYEFGKYKYALSTNARSREILLVGV